jgi:hypothetical protein
MYTFIMQGSHSAIKSMGSIPVPYITFSIAYHNDFCLGNRVRGGSALIEPSCLYMCSLPVILPWDE